MVLLLLIFIGCATSGSINKTQFIDAKYPLKVTFPDKYELSSTGKNSTERVSAVYYERELDVVGGLILLKPVFVVSLFDNNKPFNEFISDNKERFFEPRYYFKYNVESTKDVTGKGYPIHLIYFTSSVASAGDGFISIKGNNIGITGFINLNKYYIKIEYIANSSKFKQADFDFVLDNIVMNYATQ